MRSAKPSLFKLQVIDPQGKLLTLENEKSFEALFHVRYIASLEYASWQVERWVKKLCARAFRRGNIDHNALWLGKLHNREMEEGAIPHISVRYINETMGYGVFTQVPIPAWQFVGEYTGVVRRRKWFTSKTNHYTFMYPREWLSSKLFTIDGEKEGNFTRFINHSDTPNCESIALFHGGVFHIIFRAIRDIAPGEELSYDYGDLYWKRRAKAK